MSKKDEYNKSFKLVSAGFLERKKRRKKNPQNV
jgi:hypothetical protein